METTQTTPDFKAIRRAMGMSQIEMSVAAKVSLGTVIALEHGRLRNPQPRIARQLAEQYGVEISIIANSAVAVGEHRAAS